MTVQANGRTIFNGRYVDVRPLGGGQYGQVRLCVDLRCQELVAVKICSKAALPCCLSRSQLSLDSRLSHVHRSRLFASSARTAVPRESSFASVASQALRDPLGSAHGGLHQHLSAVSLAAGSAADDGGGVNASDASGSTRFAASLGQHALVPRCVSGVPGVCAAPRRALWRRASVDVGGVPSEDASAGTSSQAAAAATLAHEVHILRGLDHPNVVRLHAAVDDPAASDVVLVLEHVFGGTLEPPRSAGGVWAPQPEARVRAWVRDVGRPRVPWGHGGRAR
jgi:serine/threonine protein kinase